jgi:hypothetical protein
LRKAGLTQDELLRVYCSTIRSVVEFCSVVYGPLLTQAQSESLERLQSQCLKIIYGFDRSYASLLQTTQLETLKDRRRGASLKFARKCLGSQYSHWFPLNDPARRTRNTKTYKEEYARCNRLRNTPIFYMRRLLNEEEP